MTRIAVFHYIQSAFAKLIGKARSVSGLKQTGSQPSNGLWMAAPMIVCVMSLMFMLFLKHRETEVAEER